ncbi:MAG: VIT and VWA domain-containing protein [bacterium]|nr:VIT and VWA domain-containing protein [bacterium]
MARLLLPLLLALPLSAQGLLLQPQPNDPGPNRPPGHHTPTPPRPGGRRVAPRVELQKTAIRAEIVDGVATTTIEQTFHNHGRREAEGTWFMPLPSGAVADGFTMSVGGVELAGEVLDAGQARSVYESIVRRKRDPGLLEYAGEGMLRARVYPIPAQDSVVVTVRLRQILQPLGNVFEWQWPLRATKYGDTGQGQLSMDVVIRSQSRLATVVTPHGSAEVTRKNDHEARVTFEGSGVQAEDLEVLYGLSEQEFGLHLLTWRQLADPGYFVMLLSPPRQVEHAPRRCVQFVVDTSGSMKGAKIQQAKAALGMFLRSLQPQDLFQIVTFSSSVQPFFDGPRLATAENLAAAKQRISQLEAKGGTNIAEALREAFTVDAPAADDEGPWLGQIVFVTDGQPTVGVTKPESILKLAKQHDKSATRLFALGVGDEIDVRLIDDLVEQHRGARDFVRNREKIELKVDALCQKISQPALTDVEIRCDGLDSFDVHPTRTRDMFCGDMLQVVGRYRDHGMKTVRLRGMQGGKQREFVFEVDFPKLSEKHTFVQTIWARQHVAALLDAIRKNGTKKELVDEVRRLATRYGIVTPYTSQLIVEEGMRLANDDVRRVQRVQRERDRRRRGGRGGTYMGPGDVMPNPGGGAASGGPSSRGVASGPTTGGPAGPSTPGAAGPSSPAPGRAGGGPVASGAVRTGLPDAGRLPQAKSIASLGKKRTGKAAVEESLATGSDDFYLGGGRKADRNVAREQKLVRRAAGRVFVNLGKDLVEQGLPKDWAKTAVVIEAFSVDYFALLRQNPKLRDVLALGDRIVFRDGKRIVHVKPASKPAGKPPAKKSSQQSSQRPTKKSAGANK